MADLPPIPAWFDCTRHTAEREAQVAALVEAARAAFPFGHDTRCRASHGDNRPCICGLAALRAALAPFRPKPKEDTDAR